ncbi:MAG: cytochrome c biogenesis protein CcsA [Elusimicrobia bacterium]|nr:cytochrome c biogenesis protein CcsA [Elusimicrobiota bacterium]
MMEFYLFGMTSVFYAIATGFALFYLYSRHERWSRWMLYFLGAGVCLHLPSFAFRLQEFWSVPANRYYVPINSFYGALSYLALVVALTFFVVEARHRLGILGAFVLPWACLASLSAVFRACHVGNTEIYQLTPALRSYWINIHPMMLMTAYAILGNAFGVGLAFLVQENQVKSRRPTELCYRLPAIADLEDLNYHLVVFAFPILVFGILVGGIWAYGAWGRFWGWDAKEIWALVTALVYGGYLVARAAAGWRGVKAVYISMLGFGCAVFTFVGVNFLSELHGYLSKKG